MRIALTCPYAWEDSGGVQVHVGELAQRLAGRGHDVVVLTPARRPPSQSWVHQVGSPVNLPYNSSNAPIDPRPWSRGKVRLELRAFRPDVIHAHEPLTPSTSMWSTLEAGPVPVVATFHSAAARSWLFDISAPILRRVARRLTTRIAVSQAAAAFARARIGGTFEIVANGVDVRRFAAAEPLDLGPGRKLLFVGRLDERKGFRMAVRAFARLAPERPELGLVVVGEGPERAALAELPPALRERVQMAGAVPHREIPAYYRACDLYLGPAVGGESFGIVLVEAMASGLPAVVSDIAGYSEVIRDGIDGILVPPRDPGALSEAAALVLDDPELASRLAAGGRERARDYDWDTVTTRIEDIYRRAAASGPPSLR